MVGEADEVEVHVLDAVLLQDALVLDQLRQIQIIQASVLAAEMQVVQCRDAVRVPRILHAVILDDVLHHADAALVRAHVQRLFVGGHQIDGRRHDGFSPSLGCATGHVTVLINQFQLIDLVSHAGLILGVAHLRLVPRQLWLLGVGALLLEPDAVAAVPLHGVVTAALALWPVRGAV